MKYYVIFLLLLGLFGVNAECDCVSNGMPSEKRHLKKKNVKIREAPKETIGTSYRRPLGDSKMYRAAKSYVQSTECESEQVHIALGDTLDSAVVSYVSNTFNSEVYYSTDKEAVINMDTTSKSLLIATGTTRSHSELYYIIKNLVDPSMGTPISTEESIRALEDTTNWAYDKDTGEHW